MTAVQNHAQKIVTELHDVFLKESSSNLDKIGKENLQEIKKSVFIDQNQYRAIYLDTRKVTRILTDEITIPDTMRSNQAFIQTLQEVVKLVEKSPFMNEALNLCEPEIPLTESHILTCRVFIAVRYHSFDFQYRARL